MHDDESGDDQSQEELFPTEQPTVDASSIRTLRAEKKRIKFEQHQAKQFWLSVFTTESGRREMWDLLDAAHAFDERFACGPNGFPQPEATWFHAGEQAFGLRLYQTWVRDADLRPLIFKMHDENDHRFKRRVRRGDA